VNLNRLGGGCGRTLPPKLVDQLVGADRLVGVQQQQRQQRPLLAPTKRERAALVEDLERTEDAEVHASAGCGSGRLNVPHRRAPRQVAVAALLPGFGRRATGPNQDRQTSNERAVRRPAREQEAVMSHQISPQHPAVVLRAHYVQLRALLAIAMIAVVGLTAAVVILATDDGVAGTSARPASAVTAPAATSGQRYDGGPEEGTRGVHAAPGSAASRYDGGPEEGTRGMGR
jgi:hypothetical protein